jgi:hypothetical protein
MEVIRLDQVSLWRRTQEEFSYDLKKTILSIVEGKYRHPERIRPCEDEIHRQRAEARHPHSGRPL